jgi:hypothetical protein
MIAFHREASIAPGKIPGALAFAHEICAYLKSAHGIDVSVAMPVGGNPHRVGWFSRYENLGAMEAKQAAYMSDPKFMEMLAKSADLFISGSVRDDIWKLL